MLKKKIAIAGASGFIGKEVLKILSERNDIEIIALSRTNKISDIANVTWKQCDLYSLLDIEKALESVDEAFYLVHSMSPTASLDQGEFQDYDLILSDNFARACRHCKVSHIIFLGGIIPQKKDLSPHLKSRHEVEQTLRTYGTPLTTLRAGLIVGKEGSSFNILVRLINRLPILLCPTWAKTLSHPIDVDDVVKSLIYVLDHEECKNKNYDIGGPEVLTYKEMLELTSIALKKIRITINFPFLSLDISKYLVSWITNAPQDLVFPLVCSLKHKIIVNKDFELNIPNHQKTSFTDSIQKALKNGISNETPHAFVLSKELEDKKEVRSVSRLTLPQDKRAQDVAYEYMRWLPRFFFPILQVEVYGEKCTFYGPFLDEPLLILERSPTRSTIDRQLFYIKGGLLAKDTLRGRLEFREVLGGKYIIAAIHEFKPKLPWIIYKMTQAPIHYFVMKAFNRRLKFQ